MGQGNPIVPFLKKYHISLKEEELYYFREDEDDEEKKVQWISTTKKKDENEDEDEEKMKQEIKDRVSAATQYSDQGGPRTQSAATQWSPMDSFTAKTIPGYAGHMPGRHYVSPGKTFRQEMDSVLSSFCPKSMIIHPMSRHLVATQPSHNPPEETEPTEDPYFDRRPPSTYLRNYNPIPGYQGFVPRVRTSTSSLGIRYTKAVENSLHALHERAEQEKKAKFLNASDEIGNSPKKLLDQRPLHTPRHRPHPHQKQDENEDWMAVYRRPPSTYQNGPTYIPGYQGFVPLLRESSNAIGVRYSKAALMCLYASQRDRINRPKTYPIDRGQSHVYGNGHQENGDMRNNPNASHKEENDRHNKVDRPYRQEHIHYLSDRKPSTYKIEERHPIPGYQGFIPRMQDSPSTLGLRYTKAATKTLQDLHRSQRE